MKQAIGFFLLAHLLVPLAFSTDSPQQSPFKNYLFPKDFRWCVSTSAHQIEGYNYDSDWWDWEQIKGKIKNSDTSEVAIDHWNRLHQDIELLRQLGVKEYRFSIEWAKIEPKVNQWDQGAIDHYRDEIRLLKAAGIKPTITLHHFTLPRWVRNLNGWEWDRAPQAFARYVEVVYTKIAPDVVDWVTFNEPSVHILGGYGAGLTPPGINAIQAAAAPLVGLLKGHALAYAKLHDLAKKSGKKMRVGMAHHLRIFDPNNPTNPVDTWGAHWVDNHFNWTIPEALETGVVAFHFPAWLFRIEVPGLKGTEDYFGLNYYSRDLVDFTGFGPLFGFEFKVNPIGPKSDMGWEIYPEGFARIIKTIHQKYPSKSILITENGLADATDSQRESFLRSHLLALAQAIQSGIKVENYCYWTFADNFEWIEGYGPRFGLYEVNRDKLSPNYLQRKLRPSGSYFKSLTNTYRLLFQ